MDPSRIGDLIAPILHHRADYAKGPRFYDARALRRMPIAQVDWKPWSVVHHQAGVRIIGISRIRPMVSTLPFCWAAPGIAELRIEADLGGEPPMSDRMMATEDLHHGLLA
jgi:hypothetical protein